MITNLTEAQEAVIEAARAYCAATEEVMQELEGTVSMDAPVEFMELHSAIDALRDAEMGSYAV